MKEDQKDKTLPGFEANDTKGQLPSLKPGTLRRDRLLSLLANNLDKRLVLVVADAGYGKTTLLAQAIRAGNLPALYLWLDEGDSDPAVFWSHLAGSILGHLSEQGAMARDRAWEEELLRDTMAAAAAMANRLGKIHSELFIVLDDYHWLDPESQVHASLDRFINLLPAHVHIIMASRIKPPLPSLTDWEAKREAFAIGRDQLRFSQQEIKALLKEMHDCHLSAEELARLGERTEGWIAGIQLILYSAGRQAHNIKATLNGFLESRRPFLDYFARAIMFRETMEEAQRMRDLSAFGTIVPDICREVLGIENPEAWLERLSQRNQFFGPVAEGQYRFHNLFREFLRGQAEASRERFKEVNRRAAKYYKGHGQDQEAVDCLLEAEEFSEAGRLIGNLAHMLEDRGQTHLLSRWLDKLPQAVFEQIPRLHLARGYLQGQAGDQESAEASYLRAIALLEGRAQDDELREHLAEALWEHGTLLWRRGDNHQAIGQLRRCLKLGPTRMSGQALNMMGSAYNNMGEFKKAQACYLRASRIYAKHPDSTAGIHVENNLATLLLQQGKRRQAYRIYRRILERAGDRYFSVMGVVCRNAAKCALELGDLSWPEKMLGRFSRLAESYGEGNTLSSLKESLGYLDIYHAAWARARQHLAEAAELAKAGGWAWGELSAQRMISRMLRYAGRFDQAQELLDSIRPQADGMTGGLGCAHLVGQGMLDAARGRFNQALPILREARALSERLGWTDGVLLSTLGMAQAYAGKHRTKEAARWFGLAAGLAQQGYDGLLALELRHSLSLRRLALGCQRHRSYLLSLPRLPSIGEISPRLEARMMGGLKLTCQGRPLEINWRSRKEESLLAFLLVHRGRVSHAEELAEKLWPGMPLKKARQNLYLTISRLKADLAEAASSAALECSELVANHNHCYGLAPGVQATLDTEQAEALYHEARACLNSGDEPRAMKLYARLERMLSGEFLPELGEHWCEEQRDRFREMRCSCLLRLAKWHLAHKETSEAACYLRNYFEILPCDQENRELYWQALCDLGDRAAAARDYLWLKRTLRRELNERICKRLETAARKMAINNS